MDRAKKFYETIFDIEISLHDFGGLKMGWFPDAGQAYGASGTLILQESYVPSHEGTLVYLTCDDVQDQLNKIPDAGGKILVEKRMISEDHGYMAVFEDSEGNRMALYSKK